MVGLNFATCFLRSDGHMRPDTPIDLMVRQLDYLLEKLGENHTRSACLLLRAQMAMPFKSSIERSKSCGGADFFRYDGAVKIRSQTNVWLLTRAPDQDWLDELDRRNQANNRLTARSI
jgi:hypothetical protein